MLGALEVKAITRFAKQHGSDWKPVHTAVLQGLLAHRNRRTGRCFPERRLLAANCNVSESTIDRTIAQLTAWGAIERQQPRALSSQQFREAQYTFLFELPQTAENPCELPRKNCADQTSRASNFGGAVRQNPGEPRVTNSGAVRQNRGPNKEEVKDLEVKDPLQSEKGEAPPPDEIFQVVASPELQKMHDEFWEEMEESQKQWDALPKGQRLTQTMDQIRAARQGNGNAHNDPCYEEEQVFFLAIAGLSITEDEARRLLAGEGYNAPTPAKPCYTQRDFDERDWRKLNRELDLIRNASVGDGSSGEARFKVACQRAGISPRRGYELWERMMA